MKFSPPNTVRIALERTGRIKTPSLDEVRWATARTVFHLYVGFCLFSLVGGFLTAPVMSWYFCGDWRFWRHMDWLPRLFPHGFRMLRLVLQGQNGGFMLDVPLTAPPASSVNRERVELSPSWDFGLACGPCNRCCSKIRCPVLDAETGLCRGYDSFFWRYFNCGRYPSSQREIDYYLCNKWQMKPARWERRRTSPAREDLVA